MFVGTMDADNARERVQGIKETIAGTKIEIVDIRTDGVDFAKAKANMEDVLRKYPRHRAAGRAVYLQYAADLQRGEGGRQGRQGQDRRLRRGPADAARRPDGTIQSTIVQQPFEFGYQSMIDMSKILNGDKSFIPADKQIIMPTRVIDKSNVEEFADDEGTAEEVG